MTVSFQEVSNNAGINYQGESYGVAWSDYNNDGLPDLWVTNHLTPAVLYLNQGNGNFADRTAQAFDTPNSIELVDRDLHGPQWADFDNDGDKDLLQQRASDNAVGVNIIFVNENGSLIDRASNLGIDIPSRGRTPLWFDFDRDGLLDMLVNGGARTQAPPTVFRQRNNNTFENANSLTGFNLNSTGFAQLSDFTGDGIAELIVDGRTIFDTSSTPFNNITNSFAGNLIQGGIEDATIGDFNGDLRPDLYLARKGEQSDLFQDDARSFNAFFRGDNDEKGASFRTTGDVTFELATKASFLSISDIKIGSSGLSPSDFGFNDFKFTLDPDDPDVRGIAPHNPGNDLGVFIGYDPNSQEWQILWSRPDNRPTYAFVDSTSSISQLNAIGFDPDDQFVSGQLLINNGSGFVDRSQQSGIADLLLASERVVSGDFDNDMDLDLYVLNTGYAGNRENVLYDNQGNGTFVAIPDARGAAGTDLGLGDSVTTVDYDGDGFLDIFVANGNFFAGLGVVSREFYNDAPYELFRNRGNRNKWLQVDLEGVLSNRDGIGASVFVTAGGVTQLREQNGGMHKHNQNFQRLHFGLKNRNSVNTLEVRWSNGVVQKLRNIDANQIIKVVEGIGFNDRDTIEGSTGNDNLVGNGGNDLLRGRNGRDTLNGGAGSDRLFGDGGDDELRGESGNDIMNGGGGNDLMLGIENNDLMRGQGGNDTVNGGGGQDTLFGNGGSDLLQGLGGNDTLDGGGGQDTLDGGGGRDLLIGGQGNDVITGGSSQDTFRFLQPNHGNDEIIDFTANNETIEVKASAFGGGLTLGALPNSRFVLGNNAQDSGDRFIYNQNTGQLKFDVDGTGNSNPIVLATLSNLPQLSAGNIVAI